MRTIKFRGKVKYNGQHFFSGEWVEGFYAYKELTGTHLILVERAETQRYASYFVEVEVDSETLGQFTGLLDKNGVEIFEGDLIEWSSKDIDGSKISQVDKVMWINDGFVCGKELEPLLKYLAFNSNYENLEVIGNVNEVPHV